MGGGSAAWVALALQAAGAGAPVETLAPSGKWEVQFEQELCAMSRRFGSGAGERILAFRPFPTNSQMEAAVILPKGRQAERRGPATVMIGPSGRTFEGDFQAFGLKGGERIIHMYLDHEVLDAAGDTTDLTIVADGVTQRFALNRPRAALKFLDQCETSLIKEWGIDPALFAAAVTRPRGNPGAYFTADNYPRDALARRAQGRAVAVLKLDATGVVTDCRIIQSAKDEALDAETCTGARRIMFKPARNAANAPIATWYLLPVRWALPG